MTLCRLHPLSDGRQHMPHDAGRIYAVCSADQSKNRFDDAVSLCCGAALQHKHPRHVDLPANIRLMFHCVLENGLQQQFALVKS